MEEFLEQELNKHKSGKHNKTEKNNHNEKIKIVKNKHIKKINWSENVYTKMSYLAKTKK